MLAIVRTLRRRVRKLLFTTNERYRNMVAAIYQAS